MKICFVNYPGKATQIEPLVAASEQDQEEDDDGDENDSNNNYVVVCKEPLPAADDMNSYEASWQECRMKWCLRSRSKDHQGSAVDWTEDDKDDNYCTEGDGRGRMVVGRRNPSEKRQACSSDSTGSSQEEQDAAAAAAASSRRPKAKPLSRVQSVRNDTTAHRYRTRQRVAAEILDEQRAEASAAALRDLCRSSSAKIKKSLSFRNPAPKKVATGGDRLIRPVADDDDHYNNNNRPLHYNRHLQNNNNHPPQQHYADDEQRYHQQQQQQQQLVVAAATSTAAVPSTASTAPVAVDNNGQDNFAIPRPKLIVPVHTYGLRKRRTGNTISSNRTASDANANSTCSTVASSSGSSSTTTDSKKHHNSCPGKETFIHRFIL